MKNRFQSPIDELRIIAKLADLKEDHYQTSLLLNAITELLIDKGIITAEEIRDKAARLDAGATTTINATANRAAIQETAEAYTDAVEKSESAATISAAVASNAANAATTDASTHSTYS